MNAEWQTTKRHWNFVFAFAQSSLSLSLIRAAFCHFTFSFRLVLDRCISDARVPQRIAVAHTQNKNKQSNNGRKKKRTPTRENLNFRGEFTLEQHLINIFSVSIALVLVSLKCIFYRQRRAMMAKPKFLACMSIIIIIRQNRSQSHSQQHYTSILSHLSPSYRWAAALSIGRQIKFIPWHGIDMLCVSIFPSSSTVFHQFKFDICKDEWWNVWRWKYIGWPDLMIFGWRWIQAVRLSLLAYYYYCARILGKSTSKMTKLE